MQQQVTRALSAVDALDTDSLLELLVHFDDFRDWGVLRWLLPAVERAFQSEPGQTLWRNRQQYANVRRLPAHYARRARDTHQKTYQAWLNLYDDLNYWFDDVAFQVSDSSDFEARVVDSHQDDPPLTKRVRISSADAPHLRYFVDVAAYNFYFPRGQTPLERQDTGWAQIDTNDLSFVDWNQTMHLRHQLTDVRDHRIYGALEEVYEVADEVLFEWHKITADDVDLIYAALMAYADLA
jgi:hypothetical protein